MGHSAEEFVAASIIASDRVYIDTLLQKKIQEDAVRSCLASGMGVRETARALGYSKSDTSRIAKNLRGRQEGDTPGVRSSVPLTDRLAAAIVAAEASLWEQVSGSGVAEG